MEKLNVKVFSTSAYELPEYATPGSAGLDLKANISTPITLMPMERALIPTGLRIALPVGYEAQVRPRSGLALKHGLTVCNSPGTVDSDYRGEIGVILINLGDKPYKLSPGERIAQLVLAKHEQINWILTAEEELGGTERGEGGFGHTGK